MKFNQADILKHYAEGTARDVLSNRSVYNHGGVPTNINMYRYVVLDVVSDPNLYSEDTDFAKEQIDKWNQIGVSNIQFARFLPRNTIIGKRLNNSLASQANNPIFLFPLLPSHLALPCKPGEHVWVFYESSDDRNVGYWLCRITELGHIDDVNHSHMPRVGEPTFFPGGTYDTANNVETDYTLRPGRSAIDSESGERITAISSTTVLDEKETFYEDLVTKSNASKLSTYEPIPRFKKRPGDVAIEGSNNSLIVLGTDRLSSAKKNESEARLGAGSIDIVVGRGQTKRTLGNTVATKSLDGKTLLHEETDKRYDKVVSEEGDLDLKNDRSRIAISQSTKVDKNFGIADKSYHATTNTPGKPVTSGGVEEETGAITIKSDKIRLIARCDVEILVTGFENDDAGKKKSLENADNFAAIVIKSNGDIILRPSGRGVLKLGGDDANLAVLCNESVPGVEGTITSAPIVDTMGGSQGQGGPAGQFATKVLLK